MLYTGISDKNNYKKCCDLCRYFFKLNVCSVQQIPNKFDLYYVFSLHENPAVIEFIVQYRLV